MHSENLNELFTALAKAQAQIKGTPKDAKNPYFKSEYSSLHACWEACRVALSSNGLTIVQPIIEKEGKLFLYTILGHTSGQFMQSQIPIVPLKPDPQTLGSLISYMRRYSLVSMVGLSQVDDDGENAMEEYRNPTPPEPVREVFKELPMETFKDKLREMSGSYELYNLDGYIRHLQDKSPGKAFTVAQIMEQALRPERAQAFCAGWRKWAEGEGK